MLLLIKEPVTSSGAGSGNYGTASGGVSVGITRKGVVSRRRFRGSVRSVGSVRSRGSETSVEAVNWGCKLLDGVVRPLRLLLLLLSTLRVGDKLLEHLEGSRQRPCRSSIRSSH